MEILCYYYTKLKLYEFLNFYDNAKTEHTLYGMFLYKTKITVIFINKMIIQLHYYTEQ